MGTDTTTVAVLATHYPALSHTFIEREVEGLRAAGMQVVTYAVRPMKAHDALSASARREALSTTCLSTVGLVQWLRAVSGMVVRHPRSFLRTLADALKVAKTMRARARQLVYFVEAVVLLADARARGVTHVHAHHANAVAEVARLVCAMSAAFGKPWTWSVALHGPVEFSNVRDFDLARKCTSADLVSCISHFARSQVMAIVPDDHWDKLKVVHMGVDLTRYHPLDALRMQRDPQRPLRIVFVGRLVPEKGPTVLIDAVRRMLAEGIDVELRIVGAGPLFDGLVARVEDSSACERIALIGPVGQDDILAHYEWADILCLPSFSEGLPVVLMEALATELPVVTTRIAGVSELVEHDRCGGLLVTPGRVDELVAALTRLASNPSLRSALGRCGRRRIERDFDSSHEARRLSAWISDVSMGVRLSAQER